MNTLLSQTRRDDARLHDLNDLTLDARVSPADRLALRLGLWLLLRTERRALRRDDRDALARRRLARTEYARREREAAYVRAAVLMQYR